MMISTRAVPTRVRLRPGIIYGVLDGLLPTYHQRSVHCRPVPASPAAAVAAARALTVEEVRGFRWLLGMRALPGLARGRSPVAGGGLIDLGLRHGFGVLADVPDAFAVGLIGQPWRLAGGEVVRFAGPGEFVAFDRPGFVKVAAGFRAVADRDGCVLCTETRVAATDEVSGRRFARYWAVIRPFGGWLRREALAAVARRAG